MSATPWNRQPGADAASLATEATSAASARANFRLYLWLLSAFWVYVPSRTSCTRTTCRRASSTMKVEHCLRPLPARLLQHLLLYPLFILCMWRSLRTGWAPLWRTLPVQLLFALVFAVLASPALRWAST